MTKRHVVYLVIAAIALTAFSAALAFRDSRDWRANRSRRLFPFPWRDAVAVSIAGPDGAETRFRKSPGGEWQIRLADDLWDSLSPEAVDELAALATLTWREPLPDSPPPPAASPTLTASNGAGLQVRLSFGTVSDNLRAVTVDGNAETVYGVNQDLLSFLDWPEERFRNMNLAAAGSGMKPTSIVLSPQGAGEDLRIILRKSGDGWRVTNPVDWPVDESRLDLLFRWLERMRAERIEAEYSADLEWFGFGAHSAFVEAEYAAPGGVLKRRVEFGRTTDGGGVLARVADRNPVFVLPADVLSEISLDAADKYPQLWRDFYRRRLVNAVGDDLPSAIIVERLLPQPAKLTLEQVRVRDTVSWQGTLEEGGLIRTFPVEPPDAADQMRPLTALITGLSSLRIKTFLSDIPPGPGTMKWTAHPAWRFHTRRADGAGTTPLTLYAADAEGGLPPGTPFVEGTGGPAEMKPAEGVPERIGIAFSQEDGDAVMETFAEMAYLLCLPLYRYQSRKVLDEDPSLWTRVVIAAPSVSMSYTKKPGDVNEQWWHDSRPPEPVMDDNNLLVAALLELSQLRTDGFVAEAGEGGGKAVAEQLQEFGLDRPAITAIVYTSKEGPPGEDGDEKLFTLSIGGQSGPDVKSRYARLNDSGPVFLVPERLALALKKKYQ